MCMIPIRMKYVPFIRSTGPNPVRNERGHPAREYLFFNARRAFLGKPRQSEIRQPLDEQAKARYSCILRVPHSHDDINAGPEDLWTKCQRCDSLNPLGVGACCACRMTFTYLKRSDVHLQELLGAKSDYVRRLWGASFDAP